MKSIKHEMEEHVRYMTMGAGWILKATGKVIFCDICNCSRYHEKYTSLHDITLMLAQL